MNNERLFAIEDLTETSSDELLKLMELSSKLPDPATADRFDNDFETFSKQLSNYRQQNHNWSSDANYVSCLRSAYEWCRQRYVATDGYEGEYRGYQYARDLIGTIDEDAEDSFTEFGNLIFERHMKWFEDLADNPEGGDVRLKHLSFSFTMACDFMRLGLDPSQTRLRRVTDAVFELLPYCSDDISFVTYLGTELKGDEEDLLIKMEKLFGHVVRDKYQDLYNTALEANNFYRADRLLRAMMTMALITSGQVREFLDACMRANFKHTAYLARRWQYSYGFEFADEFIRTTEIWEELPLKPDEEPEEPF